MRLRVRPPRLPHRVHGEAVAQVMVAVVAVALIFASAFTLLILLIVATVAVVEPRRFVLDRMKFQVAYGLEGWLRSGEAQFADRRHRHDFFGGDEVSATQTRLPQSRRVTLNTEWSLLWGDCIRFVFTRQLPWGIVRSVTVRPSYRAQPHSKEDWLEKLFMQVAFIIRVDPDLLGRDDGPDALLAGRFTYTVLDPAVARQGIGSLAQEVNRRGD